MTTDTTLEFDHYPWPDGIGMIYMSMSAWDGMWRNRHQLMCRFAKQMPVLYVEPPQRLRRLRRRVLLGEVSWSQFRPPELRRIESDLHVFGSSALFPVSGSGFLRRPTRTRWRHAVFKAVAEIGIRQPILWISLPEHYDAVGEAGEILSIYHVVDEYTGYTNQDSDKIENLAAAEQLVLDSVDLTIVVSPELVKAKSATNREVRLIENAVDLRQFTSARNHNKIPPDLAAIPEPRIGYSGLIGKRLNLGLILELAQQHPEWSFVFIGKIDARDCQAGILALQGTNNVHFLGEKSPGMVAGYIAGLSIGLLPYELNVETMHISPLKMYEYLAVGLPVVSTAIPAAIRHQGLVAVAGDVGDFEHNCKIALVEEKSNCVETRIEFASRNTWDHRVDELTEIISGVLQKKGCFAKLSD